MLKSRSLLLSAAANIFSKGINRSFIGYTIEDILPPFNNEDIKNYSSAIGDNWDASRVPTPFYLSKLLYPYFKHFITLKGLGINLIRMVHASQEAWWTRPIDPSSSAPLKAVMSIHNIYDTPAGEMIELSGRILSGEEELGGSVTGFLVRKKSKKIGSGTIAKNTDTQAEEIFRTGIQTWEGQQIEYGIASGDNNFIHTSNKLAKLAGLPRTILQGVCVLAMTGSALTKELCSGDFNRAKYINTRFAFPVFPGQQITIIGYKSENTGEISFDAVNSKGRRVLKNGIFRYTK
jgi:acyl dehydratase